MKTYLSIAALLAAGTLVSNAALTGTVLELSSFAESNGSFTSGATTLTRVGDKGTVSVSDGNLVFGGGILSLTLGEALSSSTGYTIKVEVSGLTTSGYGAPVAYVDTDTTWASSVGFGASNPSASNPSEFRIYSGGSSSSNTDDTFTGAYTGTLYFCVSGTNATLIASNADGTSYSQVETGINIASGATAPTVITLGGWADSTTGAAAFTLSSLGVYTGTTTADELNAAIPEPSAFGLLAGLGALALVASRRRRTKRA